VGGASALEDLLRRTPGRSLRVLVVWEPVLWSDQTPPLSSVRARLSDPRVRQVWDREHLMSAGLRRVLDAGRAGEGGADPPEQDGIVWDTVAIYPPGVIWGESLPAPAYVDGPVIRVIDEVARRLAAPAAVPGG
jgi:hypothetical protein